MASAAPPALTGDYCFNSVMVAFLPLLLLLLSILTDTLAGSLARITGTLAGSLASITGTLAGTLASIFAGITGIRTGITSVLAGILSVALLHSVLATVGALLQHGLANRVPTAVVASVAAAVLLLLLGLCRPGQATGPYASFLLLLPLP